MEAPVKRHFFYAVIKQNVGSLNISNHTSVQINFPSIFELREQAAKNLSCDNNDITILSICELNKSDFEQLCSKI